MEVKLSAQSIEAQLACLSAECRTFEQATNKAFQTLKAEIADLDVKLERYGAERSQEPWRPADMDLDGLRAEMGSLRSKLEVIEVKKNYEKRNNRKAAALSDSLKRTKKLARNFKLKKSSGGLYRSVAVGSSLPEVKKEEDDSGLALVRRRQRPAVLDSFVWAQQKKVASQECVRVSSGSSEGDSDLSCFGFFIGED